MTKVIIFLILAFFILKYAIRIGAAVTSQRDEWGLLLCLLILKVMGAAGFIRG